MKPPMSRLMNGFCGGNDADLKKEEPFYLAASHR
jgi:hypothetical protein